MSSSTFRAVASFLVYSWFAPTTSVDSLRLLSSLLRKIAGRNVSGQEIDRQVRDRRRDQVSGGPSRNGEGQTKYECGNESAAALIKMSERKERGGNDDRDGDGAG